MSLNDNYDNYSLSSFPSLVSLGEADQESETEPLKASDQMLSTSSGHRAESYLRAHRHPEVRNYTVLSTEQ